MAHYLKKWICENGHHNWAYEYKCTGCGGPRLKGVKWYTPDPLVEASPEQYKLKGPGPNWFCNYCGCENPVYNKENCGYCGAPIGKVKTTSSRPVELKDIPRTAQKAEAYKLHEVDHGDAGWGIPETEEVKPPKRARSANIQQNAPAVSSQPIETDFVTFINSVMSGGKAKQILVGSLLVIAFCVLSWLIWYWNFDTKSMTATVSGYSWVQYTAEEHYETLSKNDWKSDMPSDAYNKSCISTWKEKKKISDGYKSVPKQSTCEVPYEGTCYVDDGAGGIDSKSCTKYRSESCTVSVQEEQFHYEDIYEDKCDYNIDRWVEVFRFTTTENDHFPYYYTGIFEVPGKVRAIPYDGTYTVYFVSKYVEDFSKTYDKNIWLQFNNEPGQMVQIEVNRRNKVVGDPIPGVMP